MTTRLTELGGTDWVDGEVLYAADQNDTITAVLTNSDEYLTLLSSTTVTAGTHDVTGLELGKEYAIIITATGNNDLKDFTINSYATGTPYKYNVIGADGSSGAGATAAYMRINDATYIRKVNIRCSTFTSSTNYFFNMKAESIGTSTTEGNVFTGYGNSTLALTASYILNITNTFTGTVKVYEVTNA